jgi:cell division protein FtsW (lipid II flippase)
MNTLKGIMTTIVVLMKLLIWTLVIFYGLVGLWYLLHGNPKKSDEVEGNAYGFAVQAFFYTVIVFPIICIFLVVQVESVYFQKEVLPYIFIIYFFPLVFAVFFGFINLLLLSDE